MGMNTTGKIIAGFVTLLIGIILVAPLATENNARTSTTTTSENVDYTLAFDGVNMNTSYVVGPLTTIGDTSASCPITSYSLTNSSGTAYTETTDYVFDEDYGTFTFVDTEAVNVTADNITAVGYTYCPTGYMQSSWGRTSMNTAIGLFAIALLLAAIGLFFSAYQDIKGN